MMEVLGYKFVGKFGTWFVLEFDDLDDLQPMYAPIEDEE